MPPRAMARATVAAGRTRASATHSSTIRAARARRDRGGARGARVRGRAVARRDARVVGRGVDAAARRAFERSKRVVESCVAGASSDLARGDDAVRARRRDRARRARRRGARRGGGGVRRAAPRGLARATTARLEALGVSDAVVDECGRRFWRSSDGAEVVVPTSSVGWLTHAKAQYCAARRDGNGTASERDGTGRATREIAVGETLTVRADASEGDGGSGGWVGASAVRAEEGERGDGLLRWLTTAAPAALRSKADGSIGVFALEDVSAGQTLDFSMKRVDEIVRGSPLVGEEVHGKLAKAFRRHGAAGEAALERLRRRFPFSKTYQTFPMFGAFDEITTLSAISHADEPNLAREANAPLGARFVATRDVAAGEEFTLHRGRDCILEVPGTGGFLAHYEWAVEGKEAPWERAGAGGRARGGIDYSKWDDVASSSSEDLD